MTWHSTAQAGHCMAQHSVLQHASLVSISMGCMLHLCRAWAARSTTWLLIEPAPKGVEFSFLFYFLLLPLPHASKPSQMPAMRHLTLSSSAGSPGFTAGLSSFTPSVPELWSTFSVVPLSALQKPRMCGDLWHHVIINA